MTGSAPKYHIVEFYAWLGRVAHDHGSRLAYKMKEDEANRLIRQLIGEHRFPEHYYRPRSETERLGVPPGEECQIHNEGSDQPQKSKEYETNKTDRYMPAQRLQNLGSPSWSYFIELKDFLSKG